MIIFKVDGTPIFFDILNNSKIIFALNNNEVNKLTFFVIKIRINNLSDHFYDSGLYKSEWRQSREHKVNHYCMGKMSFPENLRKLGFS